MAWRLQGSTLLERRGTVRPSRSGLCGLVEATMPSHSQARKWNKWCDAPWPHADSIASCEMGLPPKEKFAVCVYPNITRNVAECWTVLWPHVKPSWVRLRRLDTSSGVATSRCRALWPRVRWVR